MIKNTLCLLMLFFFSVVTAQQNLDSLYSVWEDNNKTDSSRVKAFSDYISKGFLYSNPDSALVLIEALKRFAKEQEYPSASSVGFNLQGIAYYVKSDLPKALNYFQAALKIQEEIGKEKAISMALVNVGSIYLAQSNYSEALNYYQKSLKISQEIGDSISIANANTLNNIGTLYGYQGNYSEAIAYQNKALKIREALKDRKGVSSALHNLGSAYENQGDYVRALDYYLKSLKINEDIGDKLGIALSLSVIGGIYNNQDEFLKALEFHQRSLKIREEIGNKSGMAKSLGRIGSVYSYQGNYLKAIEYLRRSLKIHEEIGDKYQIALSLNNIGDGYWNLQNLDNALDYFRRSIKMSEDIGDEHGVSATLLNIGGIYSEQGYYSKAIKTCKEGFDLAKKINAITEQKKSCKCLYYSYKALGNNQKALEYHEQMLVLNDSLKSEETAKKLQQMEFAKEVLKDSLLQVEKELQVEMAHQVEVRKKDRNRNIALGAGIFFLVLSGGFFSRWRYVKKSKKIIEKEKDRSENLLLNILPSEIAEELKQKGSVDARDFDQISVLFTDFKGFTTRSEKLSARELVKEINLCFKAFDYICEKYKIEKIKTIGDAYMAAGGLPIPKDDAVKNTVLAALEMQAFVGDRVVELRANNEVPFEMRVGIHTGPVVAGIVGVKKFQYDIWGDTVNTASRMESSGEIGKVNISEATYEIIKEDPMFAFTKRGKIQAKGKGVVEMYFVTKVD